MVNYIGNIEMPIFRLWRYKGDTWHRSLIMTYDECVSLVNFLNDRLRAFNNPWYTWGINITWGKLRMWGDRLGWKEQSNG